MQQTTELPPLPRSTKDEKKALVQAHIKAEWWTPVLKDLKRRDLTIRQFFQWATKAYIIKHLPTTASRLGITTEDL